MTIKIKSKERDRAKFAKAPSYVVRRDASSNPDAGSVTIAVNGVGYSTSFGGADSDGSGIASRLAALVSAGPYANASSVGNTVSLTGKAAGPVGGYSLSASYTWNNTSFAQSAVTSRQEGALPLGTPLFLNSASVSSDSRKQTLPSRRCCKTRAGILLKK